MIAVHMRVLMAAFGCALTAFGNVNASDAGDMGALAIGMHSFHQTNGSFPAHASYDEKAKKPLLSWRVYLLPELGHKKLFDQFRMEEPWDSVHNKKLIRKMPAVYADVTKKESRSGHTRIVVPVGNETMFTGKPEGIRSREITDGLSRTIMLIEVPEDHAVVWTKPDDLKIDLEDPLKGLISGESTEFDTCFADGLRRTLSKDTEPNEFRSWLTRDGKDGR